MASDMVLMVLVIQQKKKKTNWKESRIKVLIVLVVQKAGVRMGGEFLGNDKIFSSQVLRQWKCIRGKRLGQTF